METLAGAPAAMYNKWKYGRDVRLSPLELFLLAVGLSMDAFAVSVCKGLAVERVKPRNMLACGAYFGAFQALMPLLGYLLGARFSSMIEHVDHWVAFILLGLIGFNMIREALGDGDEGDALDGSFGMKTMLLLAVATSIDALAVGVTFAFLRVRILPAVSFIGAVTFVLSALGVRLGGVFGAKWKRRAELAGGAILMLIGLKILIEHLFF